MNSRKAATKEKSQPQRQRFIEMAKEVEADETGEGFEKTFGQIVPPVERKPKVDD